VGVYQAVTLAKKNTSLINQTPFALLLHQQRSSRAAPSHRQLQSLCCPAAHCAAVIAHFCCRRPLGSCHAVHPDCRCRPSRIVSNFAASALAAIVRRPLCRPSCSRSPITHRDCFAVPQPIAPPLLPIVARVVLRVSNSQHHPLQV
jgi:hypothetical protein